MDVGMNTCSQNITKKRQHAVTTFKNKNSVGFFARKFTVTIKKTINLCLEIIRFEISFALISFDGEYYEYHSGKK